MITFLPLGGEEEVGSSCFYLNLDGTGILLDCGIHPQKTGIESLPDFRLLEDKELDYLFISHAHQDHIGALPFLIKKYPYVKIYSTKQTLEISRLTLHNSVKITNKQMTGTSEELLYDHEDIDLILRSTIDVEYHEKIEVQGLRHVNKEKIKVTFYDAGHILGSASMLIEYQQKRIFYTGDIKTSSQAIMNGADIPSGKIDVLLTESTYGASTADSIRTFREEGNRLVKEANNIINSGGSLLMPVFSLGKTQELMMFLSNKMKSGKLTEVNIFTGGLGRKISHVYDLNRFLVKRKYKNVKLSEIEQLNYFDITNPDFYQKHPSIVLASSGMMLENTMSFKLLKYWLRKKPFSIFIVGYMDPNTPGYKIASSKVGDELETDFVEKIKVECSIKKFHFPSHSTLEELLSIAKKVKPDRVVLIHGDPEAKSALGNVILSYNRNIKVHSAERGKAIQLF